MEKNEAGAILSIDLGAVTHNWRALRSLLSEPAECAAVVKSDAYGLGALEVASALFRVGCNSFFVAYVYEGITLRKKLGPAPSIFVLHGPFSGTEKEFGEYGLTPILNNMEQLNAWIKYTGEAGHRHPCGLHFDTGMSRLGFPAADRERLLGAEQDKLKALNVTLVMSHLANGEVAENPMNKQQLSTFTDIKNRIVKVLGYAPKFSLSATAGMLLDSAYYFDITRPGCGIYGFYPDADMKPQVKKKADLRGVVTLKAKILQIQEAKAGQVVGYGSTYRFDRAGKIATAALGYADGFNRLLSGKGYGYLGDYKVPIVGRISMELTTFDISKVPESALASANEIEILGEHISLDDIAKAQGTIAYEVLTYIGSRYFRQYVGEVLALDKTNTGE
jgi:alanine racemase